MEVVGLGEKRLEDYAQLVGEEEIERIEEKAERLEGVRVAHVNSTAFGGGVAEILRSMVPLMRGAGLDAHWYVIEGSREFFEITKKMHNALQGDRGLELTEDMVELYLEVNRENASELELDHHVVVVHDPQPAPLVEFCERAGRWVWRCHIDLSSPNEEFWRFLRDFVEKYERYVFHSEEYVRPELDERKVVVMPPSIDPLSEKNREMEWSEVVSVLERYDIDPDRPILTQVGRFDPWKGVFDTVEVYRRVKERMGGVQLVLVASMARDDPEGWVYYEKVLRRIGEDYDVHVLTDLIGVGAREVNAVQRASTVVLQMSTREGFGLAVAEAMWKGRPVVGRRVGGIKLQVEDGASGFLVEGVEDAIDRVLLLLRNRELREEMGRRARERVARRFLMTAHLERYLDLLSSLLGSPR